MEAGEEGVRGDDYSGNHLVDGRAGRNDIGVSTASKWCPQTRNGRLG